MNRRIVLEKAAEAICREREKQYGSPESNFEAIAAFWNNYIFTKKRKVIDFTREDIANMMILLKVARNTGKGSDDSWIAIAGYAALGAEVADLEGFSDRLKSTTISTSAFTVTAQPDGE